MGSYQKSFNQTILAQEQAWLKQRRAYAGITKNPEDSIEKQALGLAFSGGGIRSSTFNLGVLQALAKHGQLKKFDYLSSVSGGSYIASSFAWLTAKLGNIFPFGTHRQDHNKIGGAMLAWLRAHSSFLAPGNGVNKVTLFSAILTGTLINLAIMAPVMMLVLYLLTLPLPLPSLVTWLPLPTIANGFHIIQLLAIANIGASAVIMLLTALSTAFHSATAKLRTEKLRCLLGNTVTWSLLLVLIGFIPHYHSWLNELSRWLLHTSASIAILGLLLMTLAINLSQKDNGSSLLINALTQLSLVLLCLGVIIIGYHLTLAWEKLPTLIYASLLLSLLLAFTCNINNVSMHGYYRNRLKDAFIPYQVSEDSANKHVLATWQQAQQFTLADIEISQAPFPIINSNIELAGSNEPKYASRAGDSFSFTPLYCGATSTGYCSSKTYLNEQLDLASICAISGAAVATNTTYTRSSTLNFLMSLFNIRLGCWLLNPNVSKERHGQHRPLWYNLVFRDMFGRGLNEQQANIHLSDGGHFENLGCYELIRRQCQTILCCDAAADPEYLYQDLAKLITLARVDFGAKITIDVSDIHSRNITTTKPWAEGEIIYNDGTKGRFIYLKATMAEGLNEDIQSYKKLNPSFPHQSTANQFFDEWQFEAYRELGFQLTHQLAKSINF